MSRKIPALADFRRIVVKVGSSLLVDSDGGRIHEEWLASLVADLAQLHGQQRDVMVVSSGAIALGRAVLKLPAGPLKLEDSQAAAAVGQITPAPGRRRSAATASGLDRFWSPSATPKNAAAISTRAPPLPSCSNGAPCR
jgi:hypothetical protein